MNGHKDIITPLACSYNISISYWVKSTGSRYLRDNFSMAFKKGSLNPNQVCKFRKKNPSSDSSDIITLRMNQAYDLEKRVKVNKTKSLIHPLQMIGKCYMFASLVTIHQFLQEMWCKQVIFQHFLSFCDLENKVKVTKIYSVLLYLQIIHISMFDFNQLIPSGIMMKKGIFQQPLISCDLENEVKVTKI